MGRYRPNVQNDPDEVRVPIKGTLVHYGFDETEIRDDSEWYRIRCAFHGDSTPSASLNTVLHIFRCHSCDMKGNAAQLIEKMEGIPLREAYKVAAQHAGDSHAAVHEQPVSRFRVSRKQGNNAGRGRYRRTWGSG